ncbi:hypothetical protein GH714_037563 [Hevea brasiliensis]|uniref:RRM domain-containing protein n=1 Tax=Hevea brasiliensis TaxID=3981 RepID=A0A6A6MR04_HEVBR|nr:hypothetical protein GH714_037563 [Hevea brasiliensis]
MASGWGITGNKGRCYDFWVDFSECMSRCREPKDCALLREDYLECLHHSKEKKRKISVKPVVKKNQGNVDHVTGDKIPKSFVFSRGKLPGPLKQLQMDLRKLMLPIELSIFGAEMHILHEVMNGMRNVASESLVKLWKHMLEKLGMEMQMWVFLICAIHEVMCSIKIDLPGEMSSRASRTLYVGNLPGDIREREVEDLFYKYGSIAHIDLKIPPRPPGYAFVEKKRKISVKSVVKKNQGNVDHVTGDKIPKSFVFSRGKLPGPLKQLQMDLRKLMLPYTALNLREKKRNNLRDFLNVSGPMGVTHFLILSKTETCTLSEGCKDPSRPNPYLRYTSIQQHKMLCSLNCALDALKIFSKILHCLLRTGRVKMISKEAHFCLSMKAYTNRGICFHFTFVNYFTLIYVWHGFLIVLSGFGSGEQHLKLTTIMFQNIFPAIDINTTPTCGVSRRIRKFVQKHQVPDLRSLQDVSDFVTKAGYGSESEADDEAATVTLASDLGRVNRASTKSAVKLQEIGPRMTLQLIKVEEGLCSGSVIFSEYGSLSFSLLPINYCLISFK